MCLLCGFRSLKLYENVGVTLELDTKLKTTLLPKGKLAISAESQHEDNTSHKFIRS